MNSAGLHFQMGFFVYYLISKRQPVPPCGKQEQAEEDDHDSQVG